MKNYHNEQEGFVLVLTLILLVVLSAIALTALRGSRTEVSVAGNEKWAVNSFYHAESGGELVVGLVEMDGIDVVDVAAKMARNVMVINREDDFDILSAMDSEMRDFFEFDSEFQSSGLPLEKPDIPHPLRPRESSWIPVGGSYDKNANILFLYQGGDVLKKRSDIVNTSTRTLKESQVTQIQTLSESIVPEGFEAGIAGGPGVVAGATQSRHYIWARDCGTDGAVSDVQLLWRHVE